MRPDEFKNPGNLYRNAPFWSWNDKLNKDELLRQMDEIFDKGWGSCFIHSRVGLVTGYMSEEWMELIRACADHAKQSGKFVWLYDEDKWPSGFAGGMIPEQNEAFRSRGLVLVQEGNIGQHDTVIKEYNSTDGKVYICKRIAPLGNIWFNGASYVDLMNPNTVKAFLLSTHERYKEAFGDGFGNEIQGIFTDEPCYNMNNQYAEPAVPWSDYLPDFFRKCKGYELTDHVEQLFYDVGDYQKIRYDFYDSAVRLFMSSFSEQYYQWCDRNNLKLTGHFMAEDNLISQTKWIGAAMPHYQYMHWPGIDKLMRNIDQLVTVKQVTSAAEQLGKERALCEAFCCMGQQSSFFHRKWISDWQAVLGIGFVNPHLSLYSMRGERKRDYPPNLFVQQPWWEDEAKFADYTARLSYAATNGTRHVDILVIHPIASVWSEYSPLHGGISDGYKDDHGDYVLERYQYDMPFEHLSRELTANKLDFHYGDEIIVENHARVENRKIVVGQHSYSTVILPPMLTLQSNTLNILKAFSQQAGPDRILSIGQTPSRVNGLIQELGMPEGCIHVETVDKAITVLNERYHQRIKITDTATGKNAEKVICQQRDTGKDKVVLIANTDEKRKVEVIVSIPSEKPPVLFDMMTGEVYSIPFGKHSGTMEFVCTMHPAGSMLIYMSEEAIPAMPVPACIGSGVEFKREYKTINTLRNWTVTVLEDNILPLHNITLYAGGKKVLDNKHVSYAWHDYFYKLPEGTPFKAEYAFHVNDYPQGVHTVAIEMAENLDRILVNGKEAKPLKSMDEQGSFDSLKSWKDVNFTRVPIQGMVQKGKNILTIEGRKANNITGPGSHRKVEHPGDHMPTELEAVYLLGQFNVEKDPAEGFVIDTPQPVLCAMDVTKHGYPFYSGKMKFSTDVFVNDDCSDVYLKLNDMNAASVKAYINGEYVDLAYYKPYIFNADGFIKKGANQIELVAANSLFNLLGPHWISDIENFRWVSTRDFIDYKKFTDEYCFVPFGISSAVIMKEKRS